MSGVEWLVLIGGLGLGWGVVSMLTGQRKRVETPAAQGEDQATPEHANDASTASTTGSTPVPTPSAPDAAPAAVPSTNPDPPKAAP